MIKEGKRLGMSQEMYELFKTVSSVLFYGLALFIIIRNVLKIRENKKQKKKGGKLSDKLSGQQGNETQDKSLDKED